MNIKMAHLSVSVAVYFLL